MMKEIEDLLTRLNLSKKIELYDEAIEFPEGIKLGYQYKGFTPVIHYKYYNRGCDDCRYIVDGNDDEHFLAFNIYCNNSDAVETIVKDVFCLKELKYLDNFKRIKINDFVFVDLIKRDDVLIINVFSLSKTYYS